MVATNALRKDYAHMSEISSFGLSHPFSFRNRENKPEQETPYLHEGHFLSIQQIQSQVGNRLATSDCHTQRRSFFPCMNEIFSPPMQNRYLEFDLMSTSSCHLSGNKYSTPAYSFDVFLSVCPRQYQIPHPQRQMVTRLSVQHVCPVCKEITHRKMYKKLAGELTDFFSYFPLFA